MYVCTYFGVLSVGERGLQLLGVLSEQGVRRTVPGASGAIVVWLRKLVVRGRVSGGSGGRLGARQPASSWPTGGRPDQLERAAGENRHLPDAVSEAGYG